LDLMSHNHTVSGVNVGHLWGETAMLRPTLDALMDLWRQGKVHSRIDAVFPLAEGVAAHRRMHERKNVGKSLFDCAYLNASSDAGAGAPRRGGPARAACR